MISLALSIGAMIACLKIFGFALNLFNVLAFPLVLGVGVDYGIYILLAMRQPGDKEYAFATIIKPVVLAGLTAVAGFGSLAIAHNPALRGLGAVSAIGIACCLFSTIFFILPAYLVRLKK
jgi:predicted RND superfamily exporter protein